MRLGIKRLSLAILIFATGTTVGCGWFGCQEVVEAHVNSPDGLMVATVLTRDCGATTDYSTSVNLHRSDHGFREEAGTLFVAGGRHHLAVKWIDGDHLTIVCADCSRKQVSKVVSILGKTSVNYEIPGVIEATGTLDGAR
jgi:hypothetical protein